MPDLESQFKDVLTDKLSRPQWRLTREELSLVRRWVMKTGINHEFTDGESWLVDQAILDAIRSGMEPPGTWYVGVVRAADDLDEGLDPCPVAQQFHGEEGDGPDQELAYAMQHLITVRVGRLSCGTPRCRCHCRPGSTTTCRGSPWSTASDHTR